MSTTLFKRIPALLALFCLPLSGLLAQRNVFFFPGPPRLQEASPATYLYRIPADSVERIVYRNGPVDPRVPWMARERYRVATGREDSLLGAGIEPGYYLLVRAEQNRIVASIRRKASFTAQLLNMDEVQLLTITDARGARDTTATVVQGRRPVRYDSRMEAYVLDGLVNGDTLRIRKGSDVELYRISVSHNDYYQKPRAENLAARAAEARREFNGYLVTNKPVYLPGDTVRWKAYLQLPDQAGTLAREPLSIGFAQYYGYYGQSSYQYNSSGQTYSVSKSYPAESPGVYFGEFILGDSVVIDNNYGLVVTGTKSGLRLGQVFRVEDYLLAETRLRVTGEGWKLYQKGDSVLLYAAGTDANGLPVLDGNLSITVRAVSYDGRPDSFSFLPDTFYSASMAVSPEGDSRLFFSTAGLPDGALQLAVSVSMVNSNFERKDTAFLLQYTTYGDYMRQSLQEREVLLEVIHNKASVAAKGYFIRNPYHSKADTVFVTYPYRLQLRDADYSIRFYLLDSSGNVTTAEDVSVPQSTISGVSDFYKDTAYLRLRNPSGLLYRYRVYRADQYLGYGSVRGDTVLAIYSPKGETVTVQGLYTTRNEMVQGRFEIFRLDRNLHIALRKKDIVFPGQRDTMVVSLRNDLDKAVRHTNVTVLAFNSQFAQDNVPDLPYQGGVFPAHTVGEFFRSISSLEPRLYVEARPSAAWLARCGADTLFFYRNLYLLPDKVAWLHFPIPESSVSQVAFYLKKGDSYLQPELITIDYRPVYYSGANSSFPHALYVAPGIHQIQIRTRDDAFYLNNFQVCTGVKTVFFARVDSLGPYYWQDSINPKGYRQNMWQDTTLARIITHKSAADSLDRDERARLQPTLFMSRNEHGNSAWLLQGRQALLANNNRGMLPQYLQLYRYGYSSYSATFAISGPLNMGDSIGFFQEGNLQLRFLPEHDYIYSFRPGMQRMERQVLDDYLGARLTGEAIWPSIDTVNRQVMYYDSPGVYYQPRVEQPAMVQQTVPTVIQQAVATSVPYSEQPLPVRQLRQPLQFVYDSKPWPDSASDARLQLVLKESGTYPLRMLLRDSRGVAWMFKLASYSGIQRLPAGRYTAQVFWPGGEIRPIPEFELRSGGVNYLPLRHHQGTAFDYASPPAEWRPFLRPAPAAKAGWTGTARPIPGTPVAGHAGIAGQVAVRLSTEDDGLRLRLRRADNPRFERKLLIRGGRFEFDSLQPGSYELQIGYGEGGLLSCPVTVRQDLVSLISIREPGGPTTVRTVANGVMERPPDGVAEPSAYTSTGSASSAIEGTVTDEAGEGIISWPVKIYQGGREITTVYTNDDGEFLAKPLVPATYEVRVEFNNVVRSIQEIRLGTEETAKVAVDFRPAYGGSSTTLQNVVVTSTRSRYMARYQASPGGVDFERMPSLNSADPLSARLSFHQSRSSSQREFQGNFMRGKSDAAGGLTDDSNAPYDDGANGGGGGTVDKEAAARQAFVNNFLANAMAASGLRKNFRDWAIWEPDLWTDEKGNIHFEVAYPDNLTSWKTYVLAMNRDGYSGKILELTRAYKPLTASLSAPRFLRYGDTAVVIGKVANYTARPFLLRAGFVQDGRTLSSDSLTVHNSRVSTARVVAPGSDSIGTLELPLSYSIRAESGFTDGEERRLPVYPVGTVQTGGEFFILNGDTTVSSRPDGSRPFFTGKARLYIDGGVLDLMLREIQNLKEYPYGCMEQLTTKLLAIAYEEQVKRLLGDRNFNNTVTKRKILEQLVMAQGRDGGFAWFKGGQVDYRITNYILSTMQRVNNDHWLDVVLRRGYDHLSNHLGNLNPEDQIAAMSTLSAAGWNATYLPLLQKLDTLDLSLYDKMTMLRIRKEQGLSYASRLDTLLSWATEDRTGLYWNYQSHDWYRDKLATDLMALRLVRGDSLYGHLAEKITRHVLLARESNGYYRSTATSGLVLSTILPELLHAGGADTARLHARLPSFVQVSGAISDTFRSFPKQMDIKDPHPSITIRKTGISPVLASVVYDYYNPRPQRHDSNFSVHSFLLNSRGDTVGSLKQGTRATVRAVVTVRQPAEYVMINVPIPAGCVQSEKDKTVGWNSSEASREAFKDQTAVFCRQLYPGTYTFDVQIEARYQGSYRVNPARAGLMYYPEEYGNAEVTQVRIE